MAFFYFESSQRSKYEDEQHRICLLSNENLLLYNRKPDKFEVSLPDGKNICWNTKLIEKIFQISSDEYLFFQNKKLYKFKLGPSVMSSFGSLLDTVTSKKIYQTKDNI